MLGALPDEVGIMNGLTVNQHLQMVNFCAVLYANYLVNISILKRC